MKRAIVLLTASSVLLALPGNAPAGPFPGRFGVGDSIMLSSEQELAPYRITVNAAVSRRLDEGIRVIRRLVASERLPRKVVVHLGTNGSFTDEGCAALLEAAPHRRLFLLTVRVPLATQEASNEAIRRCAAGSRRVEVIRWYRHSQGHPEWLATDGFHLSPEGQLAYAAFIDARIDALTAARRAA